ncbi:MAG: response regulator [Paraglaciecola sp.]|uniref:response regulator n=1 Tax=Paraglaciecola sp. TaxID=1920173 RepID=UPI00273E49BC|nr:response regulator [Paraglaciecola sp.]MDP5031832.1 response regulator [Paraglaciecola sp.]MDP5132717.1 response regulator [Paraglaciecola sp.]
MKKLNFEQYRMLIVDDQRPFLTLLKGVLVSAGAKSIVANRTCEAALVSCRKEKFDFIICDLHLGNNKKNGFELLEELREKNYLKPEAVFVIISADAQRPMVLGSIEKQPDEYVVKPFSQAQLVKRLEKAHLRRLAMAPIYKQLYNKEPLAAIELCKQVVKTDSRYKEMAGRLLAELYWQVGQYKEAQTWLNSYPDDHHQTWLNVSKAHTELLLKNYKLAIEIAKKAIRQNSLLVEAHDIVAQSWLKLDNVNEAEAVINHALKLSPFSISRHMKACAIARKAGNFEKIIAHSQSIWDCSKKSVHRDLAFLCDHVRSYLEVAEQLEDFRARGRFQQEALYTLKRYRHNEAISSADDNFDFDIFEDIVKARIEGQNGKLFNSKQLLAQAQHNIGQKFADYPAPLMPDAIVTLLDLGEFEEAQALTSQFNQCSKSLDDNTKASLKSAALRNDSKKAHYNKYNQLGISLYSEGKFEEAYSAFSEAQTAVPFNIGITLNLLQCSLRLLQKTTKPDLSLLSSTKRIFKQLQNSNMAEKHQEKFDLLVQELDPYLTKK